MKLIVTRTALVFVSVPAVLIYLVMTIAVAVGMPAPDWYWWLFWTVNTTIWLLMSYGIAKKL